MIDEYYIGLMSGTSIDGVDAVLVKISYHRHIHPQSKANLKAKEAKQAREMLKANDLNLNQKSDLNNELKIDAMHIVAKTSLPFKEDIRQAILKLQTPQDNEIHLASLVANQLVCEYYTPCVLELLTQAEHKEISPSLIKGVAVHGQTIRHQPKMHDGWGYTLQLNQPALLAAQVNLPVIADFRVADLYRGGQAAPLIPSFHAQLHELITTKNDSAYHIFCNIGGMSNISLVTQHSQNTSDLRSDSSTLTAYTLQAPSKYIVGFDCGPGNVLLDAWISHCFNKNYDASGEWASTGQINTELLTLFLEEPYFKQSFPKSTGREIFNFSYIEKTLNDYEEKYRSIPDAADVQATLVELTAVCVKQAILEAVKKSPQKSDLNSRLKNLKSKHVERIERMHVYIFGGGAYNSFLLNRIEKILAIDWPEVSVKTSDEMPQINIAAQDMEAMAFAWLGFMRMHQQKIDFKKITGSEKPVVLGAIYL